MDVNDLFDEYKKITRKWDYDDKAVDELVTQIKTQIVDFIFSCLEKVECDSVTKKDLNTLLTDRNDPQLKQYLEKVTPYNLSEFVQDAQYYAKAAGCIDNNHFVMSLFSPFLDFPSAVTFMHSYAEKTNPQAIFNGWIGLLAKGIYKNDDIVISICTAALDKTAARSAVENLTKLYHSPESLSARDKEEYEKSCVRHVSYRHSESLLHAAENVESVLAALSDNARTEFIRLTKEANFSDVELWTEVDRCFKAYDERLVNVEYLEGDLSYLESELLNSDDPIWVKNVLESINNARRQKSDSPLRNIGNKAILAYIERFEGKDLTLNEFSGVYDIELILRLFKLDDLGAEEQRELAHNYGRALRKEGKLDQADWQLVERFKDQFVRAWERAYCNDMSLDRYRWFWNILDNDKSRAYLLEMLSEFIQNRINSGHVFADEVDLFAEFVGDKREAYDFPDAISLYASDRDYNIHCSTLWPYVGDKVRIQAIKSIYSDFNYQPDHAQNVILCMAEFDLKALIDLTDEKRYFGLRFLSQSSYQQLTPLFEKLSGSTAMVPHLARGLANILCDRIADDGLYTYGNKNIRQAALWSLYLSEDDNAVPHMQALLNNKKAKLDMANRGDYIDQLELRGVDVSDYDQLYQFDAQSYASFAESTLNATMKKRVARIYSTPLAEFCGDAAGAVEYMLYLLSLDSWATINRYVKQFFEFLPAGNRAELANLLLQSWSEGAADSKDTWVLKPLKVYGDDSAVESIKKLIMAWRKQYKARANTLISLLGDIDTPLSLSVCDEVYSSNKFGDSLQTTARNALRAAATRRSITLKELYDELVPTLGLEKEGLILDLGSYSYTVKVTPELKFSVTNSETGKTTKSFPKKKATDNGDLYSVADGKFKTLKKNLKPVIKQLQTRLTEALECGQTWESERWQSLFGQHPILSLVGQGLVWEYEGEDGKTLSFRVSDDGSFIDVEDNPVRPGKGLIRLWHFAEGTQEEREQWKEHFEDYELIGFVRQFAPDGFTLSDYETQDSALVSHKGKTVQFGKFKRLMDKHNFEQHDGDGSWISSFSRNYSNAGWSAIIEVDECRVYLSYDDEIIISNVQYYRERDKKPLGDVPRRLIAETSVLLDEMVA